MAEEAVYVSPTRRDRIGRILAPVMINGQGPFRFVVDTGATHSVMAAHLVRHLGLVATEGSGVLLSGVTGSTVVATVQVDQLQVGELIMRDRAMAVINARLSDEDGVLGVEGLQQQKIVVNFVRNQIQILQSRLTRTPSEFVRVPVQLGFKGLLLVNARIGRTPVKAIIDTGAERTLGNSALQRALRITAPTIKLGDMYIAQVDVSFGDIHVFKVWGLEEEPALLIGMDVLGVLDTVVIDYGRKQLLLKSRPTAVRMQMVR
jgi:predicted aspartyl protease